ncbi:MAG TPA: TIGR02281 family clan AA aspartic protease [Myxococcota bacterium]|jgi:clan AA aspartic protease (TIGR02281 family)
MLRLARWLSLALLLAPLSAAAEIYQWTDEQGRIHFTQDLSQVPARHRSQAELRAMAPPEAGRVQTYSQPAAPAPGLGASANRSAAAGREVRVSVARAGTGMIVNVLVDGTVNAPFLVDTGATDVLIPASLAKRLGIQTGPETRSKSYRTANGIVTQATVMLRSVDLGGAVVENVPASISPSMEIGLLGLSFFNHFTYHIDAAAGVLTLVPNDLAESGAILGGRSEAQWRAEYQDLHARIEAVDQEYTRKSTSKAREREHLEQQRAALLADLALLESEADRARVPMRWRD